MASRNDDGGTFDYWLVNARSWWIATELCRRHAQLSIGEWLGGERPQDSLGLYDEIRGSRIIDINRAGDLSVGSPGSAAEPELRWPQVFMAPARTAVLALERAAGLAAPAKPLRTAGSLLTYRLITTLVAAGATATRPCEVRSAFPMGPEHTPAEHLFHDFRGAAERRRGAGTTPVGDAAHGFWSVQRNGEVACLLDTSAYLYSRDEAPVDLHPAFEASGRNIWRLVGSEFAALVD
jgi:hypothetical protein